MTIHYPRQDYPIQRVNHASLVQHQARRRQLFGALLIGVGGFWFYLRLAGHVGEVSMPICWLEGFAPILRHFSIGCGVASLPQSAYGMLTAFTILYAQQSHAE